MHRLIALLLCLVAVQGLKRAAQTGVTVTAVIHQPSYETFCLFDYLVLLAKGGLTAYYGPQRDVQASFTRRITAEYMLYVTVCGRSMWAGIGTTGTCCSYKLIQVNQQQLR